MCERMVTMAWGTLHKPSAAGAKLEIKQTCKGPKL